MATAQREWFEKDYYRVLGVSETASDKEIQRAYRRLAKQYHPDASPGSEDRFKEVSAAHDVLGDPAKRRDYDEVRRLGPLAGGFGGAGPGRGPGWNGGAGPGGASFTYEGDLGDLLGGLFGRAGGRAPRDRGAAGPRRGEDLETGLHLSFMEAVSGVTTAVNLVSDLPCHTCNGTGAAPGTSPHVCSRCGGRGVLAEDQGLFSFSQPCPQCGGRGMVVESPCPSCRGTGFEPSARKVKVRIPPGVDDGQRIRLKGRGGPGRNGGPPGDLYVVVSVERHPWFGRSGRDLTISLPVTFAEAALGAKVTVPTLGEPVVLKIPPGTRSGRTFRARGRGVPSASGGPGDLLVTVDVAVPAKLNDEERIAVERLAAASTESPRRYLGVEG
ncbi:MAG: molecular chaperone DnaJ [Acidimicrobiales bacterium]